MYLPYAVYFVGIVATRSFGKIKTGSHRPDEEPFVGCFEDRDRQLRRSSVSAGWHRRKSG
jgi:hypothetical protein